MFTNNYINYRQMMFRNSNQPFTLSDGSVKTGTAQYSYSGDLGANTTPQVRGITNAKGTNVAYVYPGMYFGSGKTPATKEDVTLESIIDSGLSFPGWGAFLFKETDGLYVFEIRYEVQNTSASNITISELGSVRPIGVASGEYYAILMDRTVLDEPVYIAPGETKLITYRINFNQTLCIDDSTGTEESGEAVE